MNQDIKKLQEEQQQIIQQVNQLDNSKNQLITRLAEIQGALRYIKEKEESDNNKDKNKEQPKKEEK